MSFTVSTRVRPRLADPLDRLKKVSHVMNLVTVTVMIFIATITIAVWLLPVVSGLSTVRGAERLEKILADPATRIFTAVAIVVLLAVALYTLDQARRLFADFAAGHILTVRAAERLKRIAAGVIAGALLRSLTHFTLRILLAGATDGSPERSPLKWGALSLRTVMDDIGFLLAGLLLLAIAWALAEGARIAAEHRQII